MYKRPKPYIITNNRRGDHWSSERNTVSRIIQQFKGYVTKQVGKSIWQKLYYDHIIRDEYDYFTKWQYIDDNPAKWLEDKLYQEQT